MESSDEVTNMLVTGLQLTRELNGKIPIIILWFVAYRQIFTKLGDVLI